MKLEMQMKIRTSACLHDEKQQSLYIPSGLIWCEYLPVLEEASLELFSETSADVKMMNAYFIVLSWNTACVVLAHCHMCVERRGEMTIIQCDTYIRLCFAFANNKSTQSPLLTSLLTQIQKAIKAKSHETFTHQ